jgi:hypothetical protein
MSRQGGYAIDEAPQGRLSFNKMGNMPGALRIRVVRPKRQLLATLLSLAATLFATTPGLPLYAQEICSNAACPCRSGEATAEEDHHHDHDGPCRPGCHCSKCRHRFGGDLARTDPASSGEDGSVLQTTDCPFCPFCPTGNCRSCTCQAPPCWLPPPPATLNFSPCVSRLVAEASLQFPPPLPGSLIRPPRA